MATILITGSNRGIGLELVRSFAEKNWQVLACCRQPREAEELQVLKEKNSRVQLYRLDVSETEQIEQLAADIADVPIDILLNNAGVFGPRPAALEVTDVAGWLSTYRINTVAPLQMALAFNANLVQCPKPIIASISSAMGSISENTGGGDYAYRASKAALNMVNKGLSIDLAEQGITCVVLHPGWVHTRMGGPQAPLSPAESAAGLTEVLLNLTPDDNGKFFDYTGREHSW